MPVLHMETDATRAVGQQLEHTAGTLRQQSQQLAYVLQNLSGDWQGPSAAIFASEIQPLLHQFHQSANAGELLNQRLQREVAEWENVGSTFGPGSSFNVADLFSGMMNSTAYLGWAAASDGTNFWQTWAQSSEVNDLLPHTQYHLLYGAELEIKNRFLAGEMSWDDMLRHLGEMDRSLVASHLDKDFTLYKIAEGQGEIGAAVWRNDWGGDNWDASLRVASAEARGNYGLKLSEKGIEGKLQGEAGIYAVRGQYNAELAGVDVAVDGYVGAQAKGEVEATLGPGVAMMTAGGSAFVGGRIDGAVSKEASLIGGTKAKGEARGSVSYGLGVKAEADFGYKDGVIKFDSDFGATVGLGAELGFSVELDTTGAVNNVVNMGHDLVTWGTSDIRKIFAK